ncbi:hypothetical protein SKAU_G00128790 [Synaphobranchus kaupii]|uniref:Uncharacterized protein n=1 Tax=Synaphobranchus kaupii TaxID=118154 RepID=A0A9Q1FQ54_SYNKA|nr:hypothetical protein SKAU_G00128790 [Synaphobranchus kaupii]
MKALKQPQVRVMDGTPVCSPAGAAAPRPPSSPAVFRTRPVEPPRRPFSPRLNECDKLPSPSVSIKARSESGSLRAVQRFREACFISCRHVTLRRRASSGSPLASEVRLDAVRVA